LWLGCSGAVSEQPSTAGRSAQGGVANAVRVDVAAGNGGAGTSGTFSAPGGSSPLGGGGDGGTSVATNGGSAGDGGAATSGQAGAGGSSAGSAGTGSLEDPFAIDVYLLAGQSNATGQGYLASLPPGYVIETKVKLYHSGPPHLNSGAAANTWMPLRQASESPDRFGPELGFGAKIQAFYPGHRIAIIKHAHSGTNLYSQWAPGSSSASRGDWGPQFSVFVDTVTPALQKLKDQGLHPILRATLWQQGESDADAGGATAAGYGQNLVNFIRRVREQFNAPSMLFVYGYVYPPPNHGAGVDAVRLGESDVDGGSGQALSVSGAFVVPTDDLEQRADDPNTPYPSDRIHFGTRGQLDLGQRMAYKVQEKLGN